MASQSANSLSETPRSGQQIQVTAERSGSPSTPAGKILLNTIFKVQQILKMVLLSSAMGTTRSMSNLWANDTGKVAQHAGLGKTKPQRFSPQLRRTDGPHHGKKAKKKQS
jgi:hypothetical protein